MNKGGTPENLKPWKKGQSGNPKGRPPGAISVIKRVREKFADNPEAFEAFIAEYIEDPANRKHVVEMLDGKPQQKTDITSGGERIIISFDEAFKEKEDDAT